MVALLGLLDLRALCNVVVVSGKQRGEVRTGSGSDRAIDD